ncbi:MAG: TetR/AcrR family transcriptional regulator [Candidatus Odinarchaeota archaeon]
MNKVSRKYKKGEDRKKQLDLVIEEGRAMFTTELGLSMAKLAKRVGLNGASSLYRYVKSKRELWFAIIIKDFCDLSDKWEEIVNDPLMVSYKEILLEMCRFFLKLSRDDFARFKIMFLTEPPGPVPVSTTDRGPFERSHEPRAFTIMLNTVKKAQVAGEISTREDAFITTGIIWSFLLGTATSVSPLYAYLGENFLSSNLPPNTNEDPRVLLHELAVKKIEILLS